MNTTLYSQQNRLVPSNVLKFRCRIDGSEGLDVHRDFTGVYYPRWRSLYLDEMRLVLGQYRVVPVFPFDIYTREDGSHFMTDDFEVGNKLFLGKTTSSRDKGAKKFAIIDVDRANLRTETSSEPPGIFSKNLSGNAVEALQRVRDAFIQRAGGSFELGIKDMGRRFRAVDVNGDRVMSKAAFKKSLEDVHVELSASEVDGVFDGFDLNRDGCISYDEFLGVLRGPMNERRKGAVANVFRRLDVDGDGNITIHEIKSRFNASDHPDVRRGDLSVDQLTAAFLAVWDTRDKNGAVSFPEFCDYYNGISASIDDDELFEAILFSSWRVLM